MNYLCICHYGHSRSVAMVRALHGLGHEAVACGVGTSPSALELLAQWADGGIILAESAMGSMIPNHTMYEHKFLHWNVGPDKWSNPYHPELAALAMDFLTRMRIGR